MLKTILKVVGGLFLLVVVGIGSYAGYISATWDKDYSAIEKPAITASQDPEVIKRGEYIAHSVAHCSVCHAPLEVTLKRQPGEHPQMMGGFKWEMGPIGTLYSRNITPDDETGIGKWTDAELARAIKWGVGRDNKLLVFMSMSVPALADEDVLAVVSYLRSTQAVVQKNKPHEPTILAKWMATMVGPDFRKQFFEGLKYAAPAEEPSIERGSYLAKGPGACVSCHSPFNMMSMKLEGAPFSGSEMAEPDHEDDSFVYRQPNLTPDPETGMLAKWSEEQFVQRFRAGRVLKTSKMPWEAFREMTDADLRGVYRYLKSLPPTKHYIGPSRRKGSEDPSMDAEAPKKA